MSSSSRRRLNIRETATNRVLREAKSVSDALSSLSSSPTIPDSVYSKLVEHQYALLEQVVANLVNAESIAGIKNLIAVLGHNDDDIRALYYAMIEYIENNDYNGIWWLLTYYPIEVDTTIIRLLTRALNDQDIEIVRYILRTRSAPIFENRDRQSLINLLKYLLKAGVDGDIIEELERILGTTVSLEDAVESMNPETVTFIINRNDASASDLSNAIVQAINLDYPELAISMIDYSRDPASGETYEAYHHALERGLTGVTRHILMDPRVTIESLENSEIIFSETSGVNPGAASILLDRPNFDYDWGEFAEIMLGEFDEHNKVLTVFETLLDKKPESLFGVEPDVLARIIRQGSDRQIEKFIKQLNLTADNDDYSVLTAAAETNNLEVLKKMLRKLDLPKSGVSIAGVKGSVEAMKMLLDHDEDPDPEVLSSAAALDNRPVVEFLMEDGRIDPTVALINAPFLETDMLRTFVNDSRVVQNLDRSPDDFIPSVIDAHNTLSERRRKYVARARRAFHDLYGNREDIPPEIIVEILQKAYGLDAVPHDYDPGEMERSFGELFI